MFQGLSPFFASINPPKFGRNENKVICLCDFLTFYSISSKTVQCIARDPFVLFSVTTTGFCTFLLEIHWSEKKSLPFKVKTLWEGLKIWKNIPPALTISSVKTNGRFFYFLWPLQKSWTLPVFTPLHSTPDGVWSFYQKVRKSQKQFLLLSICQETNLKFLPSYLLKWVC